MNREGEGERCNEGEEREGERDWKRCRQTDLKTEGKEKQRY